MQHLNSPGTKRSKWLPLFWVEPKISCARNYIYIIYICSPLFFHLKQLFVSRSSSIIFFIIMWASTAEHRNLIGFSYLNTKGAQLADQQRRPKESHWNAWPGHTLHNLLAPSLNFAQLRTELNYNLVFVYISIVIPAATSNKNFTSFSIYV